MGTVSIIVALLVGVHCVYLAATLEPSLFYVLNLLLHPLLGLIAAALFARWLWRRRDAAGTGASLALLAGSLAAGVALPFLAAGSLRGAVLVAHVGLFVAALGAALWAFRPRGGETRSGWWPAAALVVLALGVGLVGAFAQRGAEAQPESFVNPEAATTMTGEAMPGPDGEPGPFSPSALATGSGAVLPAAALPPASTCAGAGCHDAAVAEWEASPHRWAGRENPWYQAVADEFVAERGEAALAFCSGCHEPARLATASATAPPGVGCAVCHGITEVRSTIGQADFVLTPSAFSDLAARGAWGDRLHRWSVRLDPAGHARAWGPATLDGPLASETCAGCHKMHYDEPVNGHRWVQTMNDYDAWQASHISGYGGRSFYRPQAQSCAGCHMPPAADGRLSHRFAASNLGVALLSGDDAQVAAVEAFGADAVTVDLVAAVLGEAAATTTLAPLAGAAVPAGVSLRLDAVVATPGAGHYWPGGKLDLSDSWLELVGRDADGEVLFSSGATGDGPVDRAAHRFGLRMIDGDLEPLTHGETWDARAEIFRRWVLPLGAEVIHYRLTVPAELAPGGSSAGELHLTARLMSRQPSGDLDAWVREQGAEGSQSLPRVPPLVRGEATASLEVLAAGAEPRPGAAPTADDWRRFNDYGIGLFLQGDTRGAHAAFERVTELAPEDVDGWLNLAWTAMSGGDLETMEAALARAEVLAPELARTVFFRARFEQQRGDPEAAIAAFEQAVDAYPYDRVTRVFLLQVLMAQGDHEAALEQIDEILAVDPEYSLAHYNAMLAYRALGEEEKAEHHRLRYERFRVDDAARTLSGAYLETDADDNRERQAIHEHAVSPRGSPAAGGGDGEEGR